MKCQRCTKCGKVKPLEDYHKCGLVKDGHRPDCKACVKERQQATYFKRTPEQRAGPHVPCPKCGGPKTRYSELCQKCARPFDPKNPNWRKDRHGYMVAYSPDAVLRQHRFVMSKHLGRELFSHEHVHHLNGIRDDNRIENLELWSKSHPCGQRVEDKIAWCKSFLHQYELYGELNP